MKDLGFKLDNNGVSMSIVGLPATFRYTHGLRKSIVYSFIWSTPTPVSLEDLYLIKYRVMGILMKK